MLDLTSQVVLITGADGGIGTALVEELIRRNTKKIYATGLHLDKLSELFSPFSDKVTCLNLDVTNEEIIAQCIVQSQDVTILINNAAVELKIPFLAENTAKASLTEMKVNYIGVINMVSYYVPILEKNTSSTITNILSIGSLAIVKRLASYCASKAATHIYTETIREELKAKNIHVSAVYMGYVDTSMTPDKIKKSNPKDIAKGIVEGICQQKEHIVLDEVTQAFIKQNPINTIFID